MIYYRIAFRVELAATEQQRSVLAPTVIWKWHSTLLSSSYALFTLLRAYHSLPQEQIRVFFASSESEMNRMLERQNSGLLSSSMMADQFLSGKRMDVQDVRRLALELNTEEDHDAPYSFSLPAYLPECLAWLRLMGKVQRGEIEL
jgi:hypothetical protein